jgi:hypothetical protein
MDRDLLDAFLAKTDEVLSEIEEKARVRTPEGAEKYGQPINTVIVADVVPDLPEGWRKGRERDGADTYLGPFVTRVYVSQEDGVSDDDVLAQLRQIDYLQSLKVVVGLQVHIGDKWFKGRKQKGYTDRDVNVYLRPMLIDPKRDETSEYRAGMKGVMPFHLYALTHEYGHAIDNETRRINVDPAEPATPMQWDDFNASKELDGISKYGKTNPVEAFAEAWTGFVGGMGTPFVRFYADKYGWGAGEHVEEKRVVRDAVYWDAPVGTPLPLAKPVAKPHTRHPKRRRPKPKPAPKQNGGDLTLSGTRISRALKKYGYSTDEISERWKSAHVGSETLSDLMERQYNFWNDNYVADAYDNENNYPFEFASEWQSYGWKDMQKYLFTGKGGDEGHFIYGGPYRSTKEIVAMGDSTFADAPPLPYDIVVKRAAPRDSMESLLGGEPGMVWGSKGYVSTTTRELNDIRMMGLGGGVDVEILVPKGMKPFIPDAPDGGTTEHEVLLNRGSKFILLDSFEERIPLTIKVPSSLRDWRSQWHVRLLQIA